MRYSKRVRCTRARSFFLSCKGREKRYQTQNNIYTIIVYYYYTVGKENIVFAHESPKSIKMYNATIKSQIRSWLCGHVAVSIERERKSPCRAQNIAQWKYTRKERERERVNPRTKVYNTPEVYNMRAERWARFTVHPKREESDTTYYTNVRKA